jgi:hypothetical protein
MMTLIDYNKNMDVLWGNESSHWKYELATASKHGPHRITISVQSTSVCIVYKEEGASPYLLFVSSFSSSNISTPLNTLRTNLA